MTEKSKKLLRDILLVVSGILIGIGIGYSKMAPFLTWLSMGKKVEKMVWYSDIQYYKAKTTSALKAQNEYLSFLAAIEKKKSEWNQWSVPWMTEEMLNYDRAITYGRIAILQEREGKAPEADTSWQNAEKSARAAGWKNPKRDHILKVLATKEAEYRKTEENVQPRP